MGQTWIGVVVEKGRACPNGALCRAPSEWVIRKTRRVPEVNPLQTVPRVPGVTMRPVAGHISVRAFCGLCEIRRVRITTAAPNKTNAASDTSLLGPTKALIPALNHMRLTPMYKTIILCFPKKRVSKAAPKSSAKPKLNLCSHRDIDPRTKKLKLRTPITNSINERGVKSFRAIIRSPLGDYWVYMHSPTAKRYISDGATPPKSKLTAQIPAPLISAPPAY